MKQIEIDEEVYQALQKIAKPFEDTPNTVLRRILGLNMVSPEQKGGEDIIEENDYETPVKEMMLSMGMEEKSFKGKYTRIPRGEKTPNSVFRIPILNALIQLGGRGRAGDILKIVEDKMKDILKPVDYDFLPSKTSIRWQNTAHWERLKMIKEGLLRSDSPQGVWEITEKGREYLERVKNK
ncbi:MAG TPA: winged helix-turn-helix domain-containing protein [Candidatus Ratteibacteria bacterium]|nr:winged helix-turn-helix domain-containing protein [Candidatus Ratteibacteria bacterium]